MIRRLIAAVLLAVALSPSVGSAAPHTPKGSAAIAQLAQFDSESAAQVHCRRDEVVWLNTNSGVYHEKSMRWYGRTKHAACEYRAKPDRASDRDTRNGQ